MSSSIDRELSTTIGNRVSNQTGTRWRAKEKEEKGKRTSRGDGYSQVKYIGARASPEEDDRHSILTSEPRMDKDAFS